MTEPATSDGTLPPGGATSRKSERDRGGRPELPPEERRDRQLGVRLNAAEWQKLRARAGAIPPAAYLRVAAIDGVPPVVPEVNREGLRELTRLNAHVNQIALRLHANRVGELAEPDRVLLDQVRAAAFTLQQALLGRKVRAAEVAEAAL